MIRPETCSSCGFKGEVYLPPDKETAKSTTITCPRCGEKDDISHFYNKYFTLDELEREEYERLKKKFG